MKCHIDLWFVDFQSIMWLEKLGLSIFKYFLKVILDDLGRVWHIINHGIHWWSSRSKQNTFETMGSSAEAPSRNTVDPKSQSRCIPGQSRCRLFRFKRSEETGARPRDRGNLLVGWVKTIQNHSKPIVPNMLYVVFDEHPWKSATQKGEHKGFGGFWCIAMQPYIFVHLPQYWVSLLKDIHIYSNHMVEKHDTSKNPTWIDESKGVSKMSFEWIWEIPVFLKTQTTEPTNWSWWSSAVIQSATQRIPVII